MNTEIKAGFSTGVFTSGFADCFRRQWKITRKLEDRPERSEHTIRSLTSGGRSSVDEKNYERKCVRVSVILVNYYSKYLFLTLESITDNIGLEEREYECVVVDNGSSEQQRNLLSEKKKEMNINIISQEKNEGFACAANRGVKEAKGEYVLLLNPDIILQKQTVPELLLFLDRNNTIGVIAPKLLNQDGSLQHSCKKYPSLFILIARRTPLKHISWIKKKIEEYELTSLEDNKPSSVDWLSGAFILGKKEIFERYPLDERFFLYFEDVDFCRQVHREYDVIYYPVVSVVHYGNYGSRKSLYLFILHFKSMMQYFLKWGLL